MAQIGDNIGAVDHAAEESNRLKLDYAYLDDAVEALLAEAAAIPLPIESDADKGMVMTLIKKLRDQAKRITGFHGLEKEPHLRRGQATDQFFFALHDKLAKRDRRGKDGAADSLNNALTDYDQRRLAEEMERRRQEAERLRKEAEARARAEAEAARVAEEARRAAERARLAETKAAKSAKAEEAATDAAVAAVEATIAESKAETAYIETLAKPADVMRTRGEDGTLGTMGQVAYAEVIDPAALDSVVLWPFITLAAKEQALRAWARTTGHRTQMNGAAIGFKNKSMVR